MHLRTTIATVCLTAAAALTTVPVSAANIVEEWGQAKAPPPPALSKVTVHASDTVLLVLDIEKLTCNKKHRPRCVAAVPAIAAFLKKARAAHMPVIFSNTSRGSRKTILAPVAPRDDEPIVKASVDKFYHTKLNDYLQAKGAKRVIVCATTAFGAALFTATAAAQRGYEVVVPVDGIPGGSLYEEQLAVFTLTHGPGSARRLKATTLDGITIE